MSNHNATAATDYTAWIMGDEDLIKVDIRTLPVRELLALRDDAAAAGDMDLVARINGL